MGLLRPAQASIVQPIGNYFSDMALQTRTASSKCPISDLRILFLTPLFPGCDVDSVTKVGDH